MKVTICDERRELGLQAAKEGAQYINFAIKEKGEANVVFVTGKSQVMTLSYLTQEAINWKCVNVYHLDEFIGIKKTSIASSYSFLNEYLLFLILLLLLLLLMINIFVLAILLLLFQGEQKKYLERRHCRVLYIGHIKERFLTT